MNITDVYTAQAVALAHKEVASNRIPYLGGVLFPRTKKMGLDIKQIKTSSGLPVSLMPSAFDTVSTIRSREKIDVEKTQMAFFKESMIVKEEDEQELMRIQESSDPYLDDVLATLYNDAETLVAGANVVPERMIMSLLASDGGHPSISISGDGATYEYNYDPNGTYATNNYKALTGTSAWTDTANSDPIQDVSDAQDAIEDLTGSKPSRMIVSKKTMGLLRKNAKIRQYVLAQNTTANIVVTDDVVKSIFSDVLGVTILVYSKKYKNENKVATQFYPDKFATLIPDGTLGKTWFGTTPDERVKDKEGVDVAIVDTGIAVRVTLTSDPDHTKTTVSEICLPSFERMDETFTLKVEE